MPRTPKSTVYRRGDGSYQTTIPKAFEEKFDLDGQAIAWRVETADRLGLILINDADKKTTKVNCTSNGQYKLSIPTGLGAAMRLDGARFAWNDPTRSKLTAEVLSRGDVA